MTTSSSLEAIAKLQQVVSQTEEINDVLKKFLPEALNQISGLGFYYQLISVLFVYNNKSAKDYSLAYTLSLGKLKQLDLKAFNISEILRKDNTLDKGVFLQNLVVSDSAQNFISTNYLGDLPIKSLIFSFIHPNKDLMGVFILGSSRQITEITDEERQIIKLITNQISLVYRLQETHNSLTSISQEVYKMNLQLHQLDKMKTEFVSLASHELLTPISAIEGYLSMMLDEKIVDPRSEKGVEYMGRIYGSAKRLAKLVTDLLNVSRIEEGRMLIQSKPLDLNQIIDTVVGELRFKAKDRGLALNWQPGHWPLAFGDDDKVKEVLINLIGNSIKYSSKGTIQVTVEVLPTQALQAIDTNQQELLKAPGNEESLSHQVEPERRQLVGDKQVAVHVTDQGIGIPPEETINIFKKFYRIGDITTQQTQGTGLGLYISKSLIEMMHGRLWVTSPGREKGSTFSFSLPLSAYEPAVREAEKTLKVSGNAKPLAHSSQMQI